MRTLNHAFFDGRIVTKTYHNKERLLHLSMELGSEDITITYKPKIGLEGEILIAEKFHPEKADSHFKELGLNSVARCVKNFKSVAEGFEPSVTAKEYIESMEVTKRGYDISHYKIVSSPLIDKISSKLMGYIYIGNYNLISPKGDAKFLTILDDYVIILDSKKEQIFGGLIDQLKNNSLVLGKMYGAIMDAVNIYAEFVINCQKYDYQTAVEYIYDAVVEYVFGMKDGIYNDMDWHEYLRDMNECSKDIVGDIEYYQNSFNAIMNRLVTKDIKLFGIEADLKWDAEKKFLWVDMGGEYV